MSCSTCAKNKSSGTPNGCKNNGTCSTGGCNKLEVFDWLSNMELPAGRSRSDLVEVRFKNGRKDFYRNANKLSIHSGDTIVVSAVPGYDVGLVSLTGELVKVQLNRKKVNVKNRNLPKIIRLASEKDVEKWRESRDRERESMQEARKMANSLNLEMKISDVEYQGDGSKAVFYYTAETRVDFRELIKLMASKFRIRIEMRQIGARQESGRLGGIGSCGRELCCTTWLTDFRSVATSSTRYQQLSLNPQKLAGQCGKLKCCLNYELDMYMEAYKDFPGTSVRLITKKGEAVHQKTDIFKKLMWYWLKEERGGGKVVKLELDRVKEIIALNKEGKKPEDLNKFVSQEQPEEPHYENVVGQDDLTRFDTKFNKQRRKKKQGTRSNDKSNSQNKAVKKGPKNKRDKRKKNK
jgi:cell fate regulator YaaT (PSP1 superfamily)